MFCTDSWQIHVQDRCSRQLLCPDQRETGEIHRWQLYSRRALSKSLLRLISEPFTNSRAALGANTEKVEESAFYRFRLASKLARAANGRKGGLRPQRRRMLPNVSYGPFFRDPASCPAGKSRSEAP